MLRFGNAGRTAILGAFIAAAFHWALCNSTFAEGPAKDAPVQRPALGDIQVADYCEVLLAPKLRSLLGANDAQRESLETMSTELHTRLDNCATATMPGLSAAHITPGTISARIRLQMADFGRKVRDSLTPEQDRRLVDMFNKGTLKHIEVSASVEVNAPRFGPNAGKVYRSTSYNLDYTHYGEANAESNDAPLPKATNAPIPAVGKTSPRERPRHVRPGEEDLGTVVAAINGDPLVSGRVIRIPTRNPVRHMVASSDGKLLVTAEDQIIRVWDCTGGHPADIMEADAQTLHLGVIRAIALSPDSTMLAVGGDDKSVRLYALGGDELKRLDMQISHDGGLWTLLFSQDGKTLFSGADDLNIVCWAVNNGKLDEKSRIKIPSVFGVKYLAAQPGEIVTCTTGTGDVRVIDFSVKDPVIKSSYRIPPVPFMLAMAMSPADGTLLFGSGHDVRLKGTTNLAFNADTKDIKCVAWSRDGKFFATGTDDGHLIVWDAAGTIRFNYQRPTRFNDVIFLPPAAGSTELVTAAANEDGDIYLLRLKAGAGASAEKN